MHNCNSTKAPFDSLHSNLHKRTEEEQPADLELYRQIIGSLMHLAIITRPNIAFHVSKLSQFNSDPSIHHYAAAKHVLRYLQGTKDYGLYFTATSSQYSLNYSRTPPLELLGFSDASYASDPDDRKSMSGYLFFLSNALISWSAHKQSIVALSTMESEYIALSNAAKEAIFLRKLLSSLMVHPTRPTIINTDSASALDHVKNNVKHPHTQWSQLNSRNRSIESSKTIETIVRSLGASDRIRIRKSCRFHDSTIASNCRGKRGLEQFWRRLGELLQSHVEWRDRSHAFLNS